MATACGGTCNARSEVVKNRAKGTIGRIAQAVFAVFCAGLAGGAAADSTGGKFHVEAETLVYDTTNPGEGEETGITSDDVDRLLDLLRGNNNLTRLQLNSGGGEVYPARQISDIVVDFELDTHIHGDCDSSCVTIFLAGQNRTMSRGSRIGFHQTFWSADNIEAYYNREREDEGWETPWEFASWMYLDTQQEVYDHLIYMMDRGVDPGFAVKSIRGANSEMWRPYRSELLAAGVLTQ